MMKYRAGWSVRGRDRGAG